MDLRRQLLVIRHRLWLIVACTVVAAGAAYVVSSVLPKMYSSQATLLVGQSLSSVNPNYNDILASQRLSQTFAQLATTTPVLDEVIKKLGLPDQADSLRGQVSATARTDSTLVTVTATYGDPRIAAGIANEIAAQLIASSPAVQGGTGGGSFVQDQLAATQQQIETVQQQVEALLANQDRTVADNQQLDQLQGRLVTLRQTYAQLLASTSSSASNLLSVVDPAVPPPDPSSPRVVLNVLLAALLGLLVALGVAFLLDYLDDSLKSPDDVNETTELPSLGVIGDMVTARGKSEHQHLVLAVSPRSPTAEAFRTLRTNLDFASVDKPVRSLLVTSAVPEEGKSTVAANLALAFAQGGKRVILLDADMRRPSLHRIFELPNSQGLTTLLRSDGVPLGAVAHETDEGLLRVVTTGPLPPNPAELLGSQRMRDVIRRLTTDADLVIVDSPPLQAVTDAAVLAAELDGTLLVARAGATRRATVSQSVEALRRVGAHVLGVALNRLTAPTESSYYRYYGASDGGTTAAATSESARSTSG